MKTLEFYLFVLSTCGVFGCLWMIVLSWQLLWLMRHARSQSDVRMHRDEIARMDSLPKNTDVAIRTITRG